MINPAAQSKARRPSGRLRRHLPENVTALGALAARRQTEQRDARRQCPHMNAPQRGLERTGSFVVQVSELVVHGQRKDLRLVPELLQQRPHAARTVADRG